MAEGTVKWFNNKRGNIRIIDNKLNFSFSS